MKVSAGPFRAEFVAVLFEAPCSVSHGSSFWGLRGLTCDMSSSADSWDRAIRFARFLSVGLDA